MGSAQSGADLGGDLRCGGRVRTTARYPCAGDPQHRHAGETVCRDAGTCRSRPRRCNAQPWGFPLGVLRFSVLPQILPRLVDVTLYRWEHNLRAATTLGVVGAGGLGLEIITAFHLFVPRGLGADHRAAWLGDVHQRGGRVAAGAVLGRRLIDYETARCPARRRPPASSFLTVQSSDPIPASIGSHAACCRADGGASSRFNASTSLANMIFALVSIERKMSSTARPVGVSDACHRAGRR